MKKLVLVLGLLLLAGSAQAWVTYSADYKPKSMFMLVRPNADAELFNEKMPGGWGAEHQVTNNDRMFLLIKEEYEYLVNLKAKDPEKFTEVVKSILRRRAEKEQEAKKYAYPHLRSLYVWQVPEKIEGVTYPPDYGKKK